MTKKIIMNLAIILSLAQVIFVISFLSNNSSDNMPLFIFLFIVPVVNISAIIFNKY